jgi:tetratricopeptide (TPR) repeat protein
MVRQSLVGANLYMGRYRDALAEAETILQGYLERGDTVAAIFQHQRRGIIYAWGWHDADNATREFESALVIYTGLGRKLPKSWEGEYWANMSNFYLLTDQVDKVHEIAENQLKDDATLYDRAQFFLAWREGDYDTARSVADSLLIHGKESDKTIVLYYLAKAQLERGHFDAALESLRQLQANRHYSGPRPMFYPASYYLLGQSYEKKGDTRAAIESYAKFVELWREADEDLPLLREAHVRLAVLESSATQ